MENKEIKWGLARKTALIRSKMECSMCKNEAEYIATETNEPLCLNCNSINEGIKENDYPDKIQKFKFKKIEK